MPDTFNITFKKGEDDDVIFDVTLGSKGWVVHVPVEKAHKLYDELGRALGLDRFPPNSLIIAKDLDPVELDKFREHVEMALWDPEFSIITNFPITVCDARSMRICESLEEALETEDAG